MQNNNTYRQTSPLEKLGKEQQRSKKKKKGFFGIMV
jgi:hypothetical protein